MARRKSPITIRDVARQAGVSVSTVSRVLNNRDEVSEEAYRRVQEVIQELNYTSSLAARSMRSRRTGVVGVLVIDLGDPFSMEILRGVGQAIRDQDYDLLVYSSGQTWSRHEPGWERKHLRHLNGTLVDGMIVVAPTTADLPTDYPLVVIDPSQDTGDIVAVMSDNRKGAFQAVTYLIELGHRRIGFIGGRPDLLSALQRRQGYEDALQEAGIPLDETLVAQGDYTRPTGYRCARELLSLPRPPTAIFAANDQSAIGCLEAARDLGVTVPDQLSLVGFDNIPETAHTDPPLTTVDQAITAMGRKAIELLLAQTRGEAVATTIHRVPTRLIVRASTAPPALL